MNRHTWIWPPVATLVLFVVLFAPSVLAPQNSDAPGALVLLLAVAFLAVVQALGFWSGWLYLRARQPATSPDEPGLQFGPPDRSKP